jgi:GST-like protein
MSITFYYSARSNADRILASLEELGVPYEKVSVDLRAGEQKKPEFLALNPNGMVPTIVLDGTPMFESVAIQIALGERYGVAKGLWPALGSAEHLEALTWLVWGQVTLGASVMRYLHNTSEFFPKELQHEGQAAAALKSTHAQLGILEARLATRAFLTGDHFTLADLDVGAVLNWAIHAGKISIEAYPRLAAWIATVTQRPAVRAGMSAT